MKRNQFFSFLCAIFLLAVTASCSSQTPIALSNPTQTQPTTASPDPTQAQPTIAPSPTEAEITGQIEVLDYIYIEDFSDQPTDWNLNSYKDEDVEVTYVVNGGVYSWAAKANVDYPIMQMPNPSIYLPEDSFLITASVDIFPEEYAACAGIIFRFQDYQNFYYARLDAFGMVSVFALQNNQWIELAGPVKSDHWIAKQLNRLIVVDHSGKYEVQVNDYPVLNFSDTRFLGGKAGLIAELNAGMEETYVFDDFRVMKAGESAARIGETGDSTAVAAGATVVHEGYLNGVGYTITHPNNFLYESDGDWDRFCLDEDPDLCVGVLHQNGNWNNSEEMANELIAAFSQSVDDYQIYHSQTTITADGFDAYWVGATYTQGAQPFESSHLFVLVQHVGFEIMGYGSTDKMETYQPVIKSIMESFLLGYN